jgi:tetratricopeptide (TPR) repeat protein
MVTAVLAVSSVGAAVAYQAAARERDYRLLLSRGDAAISQDQTSAAIENYSGAIALRPDSMLAHLRRGQTYRQRGDLDAAARDFRTAALLDPSAARALEEWADVLYQKGWYKRAAQVYERRLRLDERDPGTTYKLALARFREQKLDGALDALRETLRLDPTHADAFYMMGVCLREKNDLKGALEAFRQAVDRAPGMISAHEELAELHRALGHPNEELEQLQLMAALDREHVVRQVAVGLAHARAARDSRDSSSQERHANRAILTLGDAVERAPDQPTAYGALGQVWLELAAVRHDGVELQKALTALERAASAPSATSEVLTLYGRALLRDDQPEAAERALQQATTRYPVEPAAFLDYAAVAERQNHIDAARTALIQYGALAAGADGFPARALRIGSLSLQANDPRAAVAWLTRAAAAIPDDTRVFLALAEAQLQLGNDEAARTAIGRGLELEPLNTRLLQLARQAR